MGLDIFCPSGTPPASLNCLPPLQGPSIQNLRLPASLNNLTPQIFNKEWSSSGLVLQPRDESLERPICHP